MKTLAIIVTVLVLACRVFAVDPFTTPDRIINAFKAPSAPLIDAIEDSIWQDVQAYAVARADSSVDFSELLSSDDYGG